jgi:ribosomal protein L27
MLKLNLQFFASKKGVGSTKNGRDSESKRLGAKRADGQFVTGGSINAVQKFTQVKTLDVAAMIHCLRKQTVSFVSSALDAIAKK